MDRLFLSVWRQGRKGGEAVVDEVVALFPWRSREISKGGEAVVDEVVVLLPRRGRDLGSRESQISAEQK